MGFTVGRETEMNKLSLAILIFMGLDPAMSMTVDSTVNMSKEPSLTVSAAIKIVREHAPVDSVVSQATSYSKHSNEWWVVSCRSSKESDGFRTNYTYFVSARGVRTLVDFDSDRGLPMMSCDDVLSRLQEKADVKEKDVVSMGWIHYPTHGGAWIVRCVNGRAYEFVHPSGKFRLVEQKGSDGLTTSK